MRKVRLTAVYLYTSAIEPEEFVNEDLFPLNALLMDNLGGVFDLMEKTEDYNLIRIGDRLVAVWDYEIEDYNEG